MYARIVRMSLCAGRGPSGKMSKKSRNTQFVYNRKGRNDPSCLTFNNIHDFALPQTGTKSFDETWCFSIKYTPSFHIKV